MHTLHWIAVEADSAQEAEEKVITNLTNSYGEGAQWWDWFDTDIGGRWAGNSKTTCAKNSDEYREVLERIKTSRYEEMKRTREKIDLDELESAIRNYEGEDKPFNYYDISLNLYRIKSAVKMLDGDWFCDSYFFDIENWETNTNYLKERVDTNPSNQYLVPIDFHF